MANEYGRFFDGKISENSDLKCPENKAPAT